MKTTVFMAKFFIQTERGIIVASAVMARNRRAFRKGHSKARQGRPAFWVAWFELSERERRRLLFEICE